MRVVKSFVAERRELAAFGRLYDETVTITKQQSAFWHRMDVARRAALDVVFFFIYAIIFVQTAQGVFSIGSMILLIQLVNLAKQPVTSMSWLVDSTQRAITGSNEYFRVMEQPDEPTTRWRRSPPGTSSGATPTPSSASTASASATTRTTWSSTTSTSRSTGASGSRSWASPAVARPPWSTC